MKKKKHKALAWLLSAALVMGVVPIMAMPVTVLADSTRVFLGDVNITATVESHVAIDEVYRQRVLDNYDTQHVFVVSTAGELAAIGDLVNTAFNTKDFSGKTVLMANDIDLDGSGLVETKTDNANATRYDLTYSGTVQNAWRPIGMNNSRDFRGTFDGGGYEVKNMMVLEEQTYVGFFGFLSGSVRNLGIGSGSYVVSGTGNNVGGIAGDAKSIINCYNTATVTGGYNIGGIVGDIKIGSIANCYNMGNVSGTNGTVGGIAGQLWYSSATDCYNTGSVSGGGFAGGIAGTASNESIIINNYNIGSVYASRNNFQNTHASGIAVNTYAGGIAKISNCFNTGNLQVVNTSTYGGETYAGGISTDDIRGVVTNNFNMGNITATSNDISYAGLIINNSVYSSHVENNFYDGDITANGDVVNDSIGTAIYNLKMTLAASGYKFDHNGNPVFAGAIDNVWHFVAEEYPTLKLFAQKASAQVSEEDGVLTANVTEKSFLSDVPMGELSYQWYRSTNFHPGYSPISDATQQSYTPTVFDGGGTIFVRVSAENYVGEVMDFAAVDTIAASLEVEDIDLNNFYGSIIEGYNSLYSINLTVRNNGGSIANVSGVTVSSGDFTVTDTTGTILINGVDYSTWNIKPNEGLSAGLHTATITVAYDDGKTATATVSFNVMPATYDISLSPSDDVDFGIVTIGYTHVSSRGIYVSNSGNTNDNVNITLSGTDADSFNVSPSTISNIGQWSGGYFYVEPKIGLAVGEYHAIVTVTGTANSHSFDVKFEVTAEPTYTIAIDQNAPLDFGVEVVGYNSTPSQTITISNNGNSINDVVYITLSGAVGAFTVTPSTIFDIGAGDNVTFTVEPNTGLAIGTYNATVMVSGRTNHSTFDVKFRVVAEPTHILNVNTSNVEFDTNTIGYTPVAPQTIIVKNDGNIDISDISMTLTDVSGSANAFSLSKSNITTLAAGSSETFNIVPATSLPVGTHKATITITLTDGYTVRIPVSFIVSPVSTPVVNHTITTTAGTGGTVSGGGTVNAGSSVTVRATPNSNYSFNGWYENNSRVSTAGVYTFVANANRALEARFTYINNSNNNSSGSSSSYNSSNSGNSSSSGSSSSSNSGSSNSGSIATDNNSNVSDKNNTDNKTESTNSTTIISNMNTPSLNETASNTSTNDENQSFMDVSTSNWFFDDVSFVFENELMTGTGTTPPQFSPNMNMSRAMFVTVLHRLAGLPNTNSESAFADVQADAWFTDATAWAYENGIVAGVGDDSFAPDAPISRQDLAVIFVRYAKHMGIDLPTLRSETKFSDSSDESSYASSAIQALYQAEIINGKPNNLFDSQGQATRAEVAAMLRRFVSIIK